MRLSFFHEKSAFSVFVSMSFCVFLRNGDGHGNGYDHDCCGSTTTAITTLTMVTIAATWWLRPRLRQLGGYDHGNGYDHDCCGSTTTAITTLAMVTIAAAMATLADAMGVSNRPPHPPPLPLAYRVTGRITVTGCRLDNRVSVRFRWPMGPWSWNNSFFICL